MYYCTHQCPVSSGSGHIQPKQPVDIGRRIVHIGCETEEIDSQYTTGGDTWIRQVR